LGSSLFPWVSWGSGKAGEESDAMPDVPACQKLHLFAWSLLGIAFFLSLKSKSFLSFFFFFRSLLFVDFFQLHSRLTIYVDGNVLSFTFKYYFCPILANFPLSLQTLLSHLNFLFYWQGLWGTEWGLGPFYIAYWSCWSPVISSMYHFLVRRKIQILFSCYFGFYNSHLNSFGCWLTFFYCPFLNSPLGL
jgi:hypothetical protein